MCDSSTDQGWLCFIPFALESVVVFFYLSEKIFPGPTCVWSTSLFIMCVDLVTFYSFQNTNGVNFYNILTQEPDEKRGPPAQDYICETMSRDRPFLANC